MSHCAAASRELSPRSVFEPKTERAINIAGIIRRVVQSLLDMLGHTIIITHHSGSFRDRGSGCDRSGQREVGCHGDIFHGQFDQPINDCF